MPTRAASIVGGRRTRLAAEILWLGITAGACAVIVVIMLWSLSGELSSGAASSRTTAAVTPETHVSAAAVSPSPTPEINRTLAPGRSSTTAREVTEGSSTTVPANSIGAPTEPAGIESSLRGLAADQPANQPPGDHSELTPPRRGPQPAQSASAKPAAHSPGPRRPPQRHQGAQPLAP